MSKAIFFSLFLLLLLAFPPQEEIYTVIDIHVEFETHNGAWLIRDANNRPMYSES